MHNTPVGLVYNWYRGVRHDGAEFLVTVWDNGETWVQSRLTPADSFGRPVVCRLMSSVNRIIGDTTEGAAQ